MEKQSGFFWPSYGDLMTSLFFIMLVLFVLTVLKLSFQKSVTERELASIRNIQTAIRNLEKEKNFKYDEEYNRFTLTRQIQFGKGDAIIPNDNVDFVVNLGASIETLISQLNRSFKGVNVGYVVIIEGRSSADNFERNYELSYERALAVYQLWQSYKVDLNKLKCEVHIAGSGEDGLGRSVFNRKNQTILIHVIPKIGDLVEK